ncbi:MAG: pyruvoyl-dependent arginine decarboxylase [Bacteroidota bacterium]
MLETPSFFTLVSGAGEAASPLNAFDAALLDAGIGNLNLLRVSSILPPGAVYRPQLTIPPGSLLPVAYGTIASSTPGDLIAAAVAVGRCAPDRFGVIMECSGHCSRGEIEARIRAMVAEGFAVRGMPSGEVLVASVEWRVKKIGAVIAAVPLWYDNSPVS